MSPTFWSLRMIPMAIPDPLSYIHANAAVFLDNEWINVADLSDFLREQNRFLLPPVSRLRLRIFIPTSPRKLLLAPFASREKLPSHVWSISELPSIWPIPRTPTAFIPSLDSSYDQIDPNIKTVAVMTAPAAPRRAPDEVTSAVSSLTAGSKDLVATIDTDQPVDGLSISSNGEVEWAVLDALIVSRSSAQ
ncbi:hypothetical protein C8R44DRAFT_878756 [Mycena epipterygia]|nr:hypothetical protein C8R44DRAFT_878756 [Mycena epipterygia]